MNQLMQADISFIKLATSKNSRQGTVMGALTDLELFLGSRLCLMPLINHVFIVPDRELESEQYIIKTDEKTVFGIQVPYFVTSKAKL